MLQLPGKGQVKKHFSDLQPQNRRAAKVLKPFSRANGLASGGPQASCHTQHCQPIIKVSALSPACFPPLQKKGKKNLNLLNENNFFLEMKDFVKFYKLKDKWFYWWQGHWDRRIWFEVTGPRGCPSTKFSLSFDSWILLWQDRMHFIPSVSAEMQMSSIYHNILILGPP